MSAISHEQVDHAGNIPVPQTPMISPRTNTTEPGRLQSLPSCIPALPVPGAFDAPLPRTLVLCFDGTGDEFDADNSNVVQLFSMLKKDDRKQQMVYYQAGIGTYTSPRFATSSMANLSKLVDEMVAWNLNAHVMDGYEFLMQNYEAGDKICIFGFSRGAYTARALAGMIHKVGLLPACNHQQVPFAYKMYTDNSRNGWSQSTAFKKAFSIDLDVEFIGVWDTVSSVGLIGKRLPFTASNTCVRYFRHAISLDERRAKFRANGWNWPSEREKGLGVQAGEMPKAGVEAIRTPHTKQGGGENVNGSEDMKKRKGKKTKSSPDRSPDQDEMEHRFSRLEPQAERETDVLEVWFAGCHCDVGGGSVPNDTRHNLARIPLRWMIRQCFLANTGIRFHAELLRTIGLEPASLYPVVQQRPPPLYADPSLLRDKINEMKAKEREKDTWRMATLRFSPLMKTSASSQSDVGKAEKKLKKRGPSEKERSSRSLPSGQSGNGKTKQNTRSERVLQSSTSSSNNLSQSTSSDSDVQVVEATSNQMRTLTEEEEDLEDALCPVYDQLKLKKSWWVLEMLPVRHRVQREDGSWDHEITMNLGRGRKVAKQGRHSVYIHRSVKIRMEAHSSQVAGGEGKMYVPKARFDGVEPTWVD